jgi:hypothetical protein
MQIALSYSPSAEQLRAICSMVVDQIPHLVGTSEKDFYILSWVNSQYCCTTSSMSGSR